VQSSHQLLAEAVLTSVQRQNLDDSLICALKHATTAGVFDKLLNFIHKQHITVSAKGGLNHGLNKFKLAW